MDDIMTFTTSREAFDFAKRKATKGHRTWVVWRNAATDAWHAAVMFTAAVERAVVETGEPTKFYGISPDGVGSIFRAATASILLSNLRGGCGPNARV